MSHLPPQRGHASPAAAAAAAPDSPPSATRDAHPRSPRSQPAASQDNHSFVGAAHLTQVPLLASVGSLPSPAARSPRPPIPSPLSNTSNVHSLSAANSPRQPTIPLSAKRSAPNLGALEKTARSPPDSHTTFYTDSSNPSTPEEELPRPDFYSAPNDTRSVSDPLTSKPDRNLPRASKSTMASAVAAAQGSPTTSLPRNPSLDTAVSAASSHNAAPKSPTNGQQSPDIAHLIKTAGSPEAVIQYLLKEKQSQSQQNSQLWRLVDKQRAMILGLNKDLEAALKDKEKYRKKLKEIMANPAVLRASGGQQNQASSGAQRGAPVPGNDAQPISSVPNSPDLDSGSPKNSPIDVALAPYPITPPADRPQASSSAVSELLDPAHSMPKPQEHAQGKFDHEAEERAADQARKDRGEEQLREIPYNAALAPSRSLPSEPPKMPPPKPPTAQPPSVAVLEPTPQPDEGIAKFPSPPRKGPPAPLQLRQDLRRTLVSPSVDEDSDSDYDDILEVDEIVKHNKRGRRKTREEDDRERELLVLKEAENRSASNKTKTASPSIEMATDASASSHPVEQLAGTASLDAIMKGDRSRDFAALMSPGLPLSPRPTDNHMRVALHSPPASSRGQAHPVGSPLSPRPPRQPIPLPPNTPLVSAPAGSSVGSSESAQSLDDVMFEDDKNRQSPTERTRIYKGLVTEEYPDLLLPPNALPSINLKVASSRMKPSRASLLSLTQLEEDPVFTLAVLSRSDHGELWRVEKDSASLAKLDQRLKQCPAFTARTPDRSLFSGHAPAKLDARRVALEQYLEELLDTPLDTATAVELCRYLSTNVLPPNADETGAVAPPAEEHAAHKLGPDGRPVRSGYLTKKGKNFGGWKARFFVLDGPRLRYFETPGGAHLGTIKLQHAQIGKQSHVNDSHSPAAGPNGEELDNQYRHAFLVLEPKKKDSTSHVKHVLCAENDKERDLWVDALLQWIDYRDPDDMDADASKASAHGRQTSGGPDHPSGGKPRKHKEGRAGHQASDSDALIGVRYDSTQPGDAPQGAPGRPKTSAGLPEYSGSHVVGGELMTPQPKMISGPKDPQPISDSAAWGNKQGLGVPSNDEKKQRKRSFFGFGPKARSSSDGQDSLFGGSEGASGATPPPHGYGPVRQVFGAPLAEAVRYNPPLDVNVPLPSVVYRCIQYLEAKGAILEEGIFRLSGSNVVIKQLRERFNIESDINLVTDEQYYDIHAVASLLKLYLRELPTTILTRDLHMEFLQTTEIADRPEKMRRLNELSQRLPQANETLLKYLIAFLIKIINNADVNKMTVRNVGIVFSPTLNIPAPVFALFLQNYDDIFGIAPEEYELPSPNPDYDNHGRFESGRAFDPPHRPSTSSGSASPHRQPRIDSMRDHPRMTPTPPLLMNLSAARASPTPQISTPRHPHDGSRPAYENSYGPPAGHDGHNHYPQQQRSVPAYERPTYQAPSEDYGNGQSAYEPPHVTSTSNKRRESSVIGNTLGLQQQASKSRLREEARY